MLSQLGSYPSLGLRVDPLWFTALIDTGSSKRDLNFSQVLELDVLGQPLGEASFLDKCIVRTGTALENPTV